MTTGVAVILAATKQRSDWTNWLVTSTAAPAEEARAFLDRALRLFDTMELQNDPTFEARGIMQVMDHPNDKFKMPAWPVRVDGKPAKIKPSPRLGEHGPDVLNEWLGIGPAEVATLKSEGVL
jgi:crotonobetainyl-CoA:carnitine CoA-transferase CaiB-like acyl-CoA transferase